jgi:hypothetical protein
MTLQSAWFAVLQAAMLLPHLLLLLLQCCVMLYGTVQAEQAGVQISMCAAASLDHHLMLRQLPTHFHRSTCMCKLAHPACMC